VIDAFNNARNLVTEFKDLDTRKAFDLQNNRMSVIELRTDFDKTTYPYSTNISRHDMHYGRASFISAFLDAYYATALNAEHDDIPTKK
jgi:hypothetical protein